MRKTLPLMIGVSFALATASAIAQADSNPQVKLEIRSQLLRDALNEWAQQTGFNLISPTSHVTSEFVVPAIHGQLTARAALERLLAGTSLTYELVSERTVVIRERSKSSTVTTGWRKIVDDSPQHVALAADTPAPHDATASPTTRRSVGRSFEEPEVVIVTAQRREERLQNVPISISVLSGEDLDKSSLANTRDALGLVPGVATNTGYVSGGTMVSVRGVAASAAVFSGGSPIAYYIDSLPFGLIDTAIAPDQNVYDLQRIEVLRGPQGTLYGASALNGVVRILTNDVDLNKFDAKVRVTDSSTSGGGNNYRGDMAVNVPIVEGKLGVRAVAGYGYDSGWIDSPRVDNINDSRVHNYRVKVSAQPTDGLSIGLSAWKSRDAYGAPPTGNERDFNDETLDQSIHSGFDAYNMKLGYDGSVFSISSMTSYLDYSNSSGLDLNSFIHVSSLLHTGFDAHIFSQEVVANSTHSESWRWSVGGIYRRGTEDLVQSFSDVLSFIPSTNILNVSRSAAAFGEVTRLFGQNRFEATLGLRYFTDHVNSEDNLDTGNPTNPVVKKTLRFHATSPRAVLAWHPAENSTVYGSYSEGFRSGFPQGANVPADFPDLVGDTLKNYEVGTKGVLAGGRVNYNVAVYYMDWQDVQQTLSVLWHGVPTTAFVNGQSASGVGAEFAVNAEVLTGLVLGLSFGWNDLRMDADTTSTTGILFHKGDRLSFSPEYTGGASLQYGFPLGTGGLRANLSASESYTSQMLDHAIGVVATGDEMLSTRLSAEVASPDRWSVMLFVDNATNARKTPVRIAGGSVDFDLRNRPRTAGLQLDYHF